MSSSSSKPQQQELAAAAARDVISVNSDETATTQTRFSFYNAQDFVQPSSSGEQQRPPEISYSATNTTDTSMDSIEILRSLQEHEQERERMQQQQHRSSSAAPADGANDNNASTANSSHSGASNPYEDAIKEALLLLRKHRTAPSTVVIGGPADMNTSNDSVPLPPTTPNSVASATSSTTSALGEAYQAEIETRRKQRQERMAKYASRLAELKESPSAQTNQAIWEGGENDSPTRPAQEISIEQPEPSQVQQQQHDAEVQLGVERVLLAILDRASTSRGRADVVRQEEKKSSPLEDVVQPERQQIDDNELFRAMSDLLRKSTSASSAEQEDEERYEGDEVAGPVNGQNAEEVGKRVMNSSTPYNNMLSSHDDSGTLATQESDVVRGALLGGEGDNLPPPRNNIVHNGELRMVKSDPGPEAHAELDRMVDMLQGKAATSQNNGHGKKNGPMLIDERVRRVLGSENSADEESEFTSTHNDNDTAAEVDTLEAALEDKEIDVEETSAPGSADKTDTFLNGVLGPLSRPGGETTGVVLEGDEDDDDSERPRSLLDSISDAARSIVAGISPNSERYSSEGASSRFEDDDDASASGSDSEDGSEEDEEMGDLMHTICAHLLMSSIPAQKRKLLRERMPLWDDSNPDEPGYRIIRLSSHQLEQVEGDFKRTIEQLRKDNGGDQDDKKSTSTSKTKNLPLKKAEDSSQTVEGETTPLPHFPGVKTAGKGEMGDLEFFHLPIIFKSHVTGFEPTKDMYLEAGNVVAGQYLVEGELGSAAFSTAYRCIDLSSDSEEGHEEVCLKVIKNTKDFFDQSLDEIKILELLRQTGQCDEMNILEMKTFFYHREHLIIVTELLRQNLFEFGKFIIDNDEQAYFTLPRLSYITRQTLIALDYIHQIGLVHSDVKPENILLASYSRAKVKLIDFGSSCYLTDRQSSYIQSRSYRAPEVVLGLAYDGRIDIWSLGCVVAEMYTGEVTFQNDSIVSMLSRIEAICGPFPKRMTNQGRQSSTYFTKNGLLFEKVKKRGDDSYSDEEEEDDSSEEDEGPASFDIFQPKRTTLSARLGFDENLMNLAAAGLNLSREQQKQAVFVDFVQSLLTLDAEKRPTAAEALKHPWMEYAATLTEDDIKYP